MDEEKILPSPEPEIPVPTEMPELSVDSEQQVSVDPQEVSLEDIPTEMSELTIRLPVIEPQEEPSDSPLIDIIPKSFSNCLSTKLFIKISSPLSIACASSILC